MELINGTFLHGDKYKILSKISQGNFGITYLAEQISLDRKVCIKEFFFRVSCERSVNGQVTVTTSGQDVTNSFRRKFMREAKRLSQFDHPNIVKVIDVFEENGTAYMVMDYVEGETLQQLVDRKGKLSEKEALEYIIPLCDALEVVHGKGLLHLDIKPSNILIKKQTNTPVLIDFGISKFTEVSGEDHSTTTPVALTKGYAPLEQYGQDLTKLTATTDVYSVAATLYKLVTGVTPPEAAVIVQDGLKPPKEINPLLSEQLNSIILQSLSVKPSQRALSFSKLKADLKGISNQEGVRETEVLYSDGKDDKNKPLVAQQTEVATEVLSEIYKPEPKKADTFGTADVKNPEPALKPNNSRPAHKPNNAKPDKSGSSEVKNPEPARKPNDSNNLWIFLIFAIVIVIILVTRSINSDSNAGNEAGMTKVQSSSSISNENEKNSNSTATDIDGNVYNTVKIGNQVWMLEDLKVIHYRNGDPIHNIERSVNLSKLTSGEWCFSENKLKQGNLYNWFAVTDSRGIAPDGWHIPTYTEWTNLVTYLGGESVAGNKLRETGVIHWESPNAGATNESGFTALPGGARTGNLFDITCAAGYWWSSTDYNTENARYFKIDIDESLSTSRSISEKGIGLSVRCIRD